MDRAHRHDLKHDRFVEQVGHTVEYATEHKQAVVRYGGIAVVVLVVALGWYFYSSSQSTARQEALRQALHIQQAQIGPSQSEFVATYPTEAEKYTATKKTWTELASKYSGSSEAIVAHYYMGVNAADRGDLQEAEKEFKIVADSGKENYSSQAKLSLAQLYGQTGRTADAEKLLRSLMSDPTVMVSKEQATVALARVLAKDRPAEARKLLEPLRSERGPVSRTVLTLLNDIPAR